MNVRQLIHLWEATASGDLTDDRFAVKLAVKDAAKLRALAELYPRRTEEELISELLSVALQDIESRLPYIKGKGVKTLYGNINASTTHH